VAGEDGAWILKRTTSHCGQFIECIGATPQPVCQYMSVLSVAVDGMAVDECGCGLNCCMSGFGFGFRNRHGLPYLEDFVARASMSSVQETITSP